MLKAIRATSCVNMTLRGLVFRRLVTVCCVLRMTLLVWCLVGADWF